MNRNASWTLTQEQLVAYGIIAVGVFIALHVGLFVQYLYQRAYSLIPLRESKLHLLPHFR